MNGLPYYKRYPRDFFDGTAGMPFELKSAYALLLDLIYVQNGNCPDDPHYISGAFGCSVRKWKSLRERLIKSGKIQAIQNADGAFLNNVRASLEIDKTFCQMRTNAENRSRPNKIKDLPSRKKDTDTDTEGSASALPKRASARGGSKLPDGFEEFWELVPVKAGKPKCVENFRKAVKAGADPGDIIAGMRRYRDWLEAMGPQAPKTKYPQGWLADERWNDELPDPSKTRRNGNGRTTLRTIAGWFPDDGQRQVDSDQGGIVAGQQLPDDGRGNAAGDRERLGDGPAGLPAPHPRSGIHGPSKVIDFPAETCGNYSAGLFKTLG